MSSAPLPQNQFISFRCYFYVDHSHGLKYISTKKPRTLLQYIIIIFFFLGVRHPWPRDNGSFQRFVFASRLPFKMQSYEVMLE